MAIDDDIVVVDNCDIVVDIVIVVDYCW